MTTRMISLGESLQSYKLWNFFYASSTQAYYSIITQNEIVANYIKTFIILKTKTKYKYGNRVFDAIHVLSQ